MMSKLSIIITTFDKKDFASTVADTLLAEKLTCCCNLFPGVESRYFWQGKVEVSTEIVAFFKTPSTLSKKLIQRLSELHNYDTPEVVCIDTDDVTKNYLKWAEDYCKSTNE